LYYYIETPDIQKVSLVNSVVCSNFNIHKKLEYPTQWL
jgi:hypothetical protein